MTPTFQAPSPFLPPLPPIVGLYSPVPGCGKTTLVDGLTRHHLWWNGQPIFFTRAPFAAPLRKMLQALMLHAGMEAREITRLLHTDKEEVIPLFGVSARHMLRTIGTEWGRDCISPSVWIDTWQANIEATIRPHPSVVLVDDVRFPNEVERIQSLGGQIWLITRDAAAPVTASHRSDSGLKDFTGFAHRLRNEGTTRDLLEQSIRCLGLPVVAVPS